MIALTVIAVVAVIAGLVFMTISDDLDWKFFLGLGLLTCGMLIGYSLHYGYKRGQIDALNGIQKYEIKMDTTYKRKP